MRYCGTLGSTEPPSPQPLSTFAEFAIRPQFWWLTFAIIIGNVVDSTANVLIDGIIHTVIRRESRESLYGWTRLWGTIGWCSMALVIGKLIDRTQGSKRVANYSVTFCAFLAFQILDIFVLAFAKVLRITLKVMHILIT